MGRARGDGADDARVVVGGADGDHLVAVAVGGLEDGDGDVGPGPDRAGAGVVVVPVGACVPSTWKMAAAMSRVKVRRPSWSSTTVTCASLSSGSATRSERPFIVLTKLCPSPMTHELRMM